MRGEVAARAAPNEDPSCSPEWVNEPPAAQDAPLSVDRYTVSVAVAVCTTTYWNPASDPVDTSRAMDGVLGRASASVRVVVVTEAMALPSIGRWWVAAPFR